VQGVFRKGQTVLLVDDAIGDGASKDRCVQQLERVGLKVVGLLSVWECGIPLVQGLRTRGIRSVALISHKELVRYMIQEQFLPPECGRLIISAYEAPDMWTDETWERWKGLCSRFDIPWNEPVYEHE
jgi:orotate phosphoribosyltransferase